MPQFSLSKLLAILALVVGCVLLVVLLGGLGHREIVVAGARSLSSLPGKLFSAGEVCRTSVDVQEMARVVMKQRNDISLLLDQTLQKLGQLQCDMQAKSQEAREVADTGGWCLKYSVSISQTHHTDHKLMPELAKFFRNKTVASFGDGPGEYKRLLDATGSLQKYDAYDGAPYVEMATNGSVRHLDLSVPQFGLPVYEWVMSLEVAEHIPAEYEQAYLSNIVRHARDGILLSWAVPGQDGFHHVNLRTFEYVEARMDELGFVHDLLSSSRLRGSCTFQYLRNNVNVFRRKENSQVYDYMA